MRFTRIAPLTSALIAFWGANKALIAAMGGDGLVGSVVSNPLPAGLIVVSVDLFAAK